MYSCIAVKLRVEGCDKLIFLSCGYYFSVHLRENLYIVISLVDIRRTDKRHRNFSDTLKLRFGMEAAELSAISVAVGNNRHCLQVLCAVVRDRLRKQYKTCASAVDRHTAFNTALYAVKKIKLTEQLSLHRAFTAGNYKAIEAAVKNLLLPYLKAVCTEL